MEGGREQLSWFARNGGTAARGRKLRMAVAGERSRQADLRSDMPHRAAEGLASCKVAEEQAGPDIETQYRWYRWRRTADTCAGARVCRCVGGITLMNARSVSSPMTVRAGGRENGKTRCSTLLPSWHHCYGLVSGSPKVAKGASAISTVLHHLDAMVRWVALACQICRSGGVIVPAAASEWHQAASRSSEVAG